MKGLAKDSASPHSGGISPLGTPPSARATPTSERLSAT